MLPSILAKQLEKGIGDYIETTFPMTNAPFKGSVSQLLGEKGAIYHEPYVAVRLPFRVAEEMPRCFTAIRPAYLPYVHQEKTFARLTGEDGRSTLIATGTGSGKTECFLYPILEYCYRHRGERGIKALIIYPMNALASDQAKRIAELIYGNEKLRGNVTAGMYVGGEGHTASRVMSEHGIITDHETMLNHAPDILLTNYKMLDYLLVRPKDALLWQDNGPETLKYVAVDELHTFDGAQGTDLACLLRRLKERLRRDDKHNDKEHYLCCIGTSATMGSEKNSEGILHYAEEIFGESFDKEALITEDRLSAEEFFASSEVTEFGLPSPEDIEELSRLAEEDESEAYLRAAVKAWFPDFAYDAMSGEGRLSLGERLMHHSFLQAVICEADGKYAQQEKMAEKLGNRYPELKMAGSASVILDSLYALISHARTGEVGRLRPFLHVQVQLWMRELRRLLAKVDGEQVTYAIAHDLNSQQVKQYLPVVNCRDCGLTGWVTVLNEQQNAALPRLESFYNLYFKGDKKVAMLFPMSQEEAKSDMIPAWICPDCLHVQMGEEGGKCKDCGTAMISIKIPRQMETSGRQYVCPCCGSKRGLSLMGVRSATEISASLSQIFASKFNDDKKTLAFSDNVQDAAHRAGFFNARTWRFGLRGAMQRYVMQSGAGKSLADFQDGFLSHWHGEMTDEDFVGFFIAPNMTWKRAYEEMKEKRKLGRDADARALMRDVEKRLRYEIMLEYGLTAKIGRTLEKSGCSVMSFAPADICSIADAVELRAVNELGGLTGEGTLSFRRMVMRFLNRMRRNGAFADPVFDTFTINDGKSYLLSNDKIRWLPGLQSGRNLPHFPAIPLGGRAKTSFDFLSKYAAEVKACLSSPLVGEDVPEAIARYILEEAVKVGLVEEVPSSPAYKVYGLNKHRVFVSPDVIQMRCNRCGTTDAVSKEDAEFWEGAPCPQGKCDGMLAPYEDGKINYYGHLFSFGDLVRVNAREHTGLLKRPDREELEAEFKQDKKEGASWNPNVLSCTPTLEMGIDIGDLSTVILCSMPPAQSQFLQRAGRAGRKDGNALTLAIANARPHDLYFYADPKEMIDGEVKPPKIFLRASAVLERQFVAFCMDSWVRKGLPEGAIPEKVGVVLKKLDARSEEMFPFNFLNYVKSTLSRQLNSFMQMFAAYLDDSAREELNAFARGKGMDTSPMYVKILDAFEGLRKQQEALRISVDTLKDMVKEKEEKPKDSSYEEEIKELRGEAAALLSVLREIGKKNIFNFLSDEGLLPNYAFPEAGIILRAILYRKPNADAAVQRKKYEKRVFEYSRSASSAISEFAPSNSFYAGGHKLTIDQVDLTTAQSAKWRLCPNCSHAELEEAGKHSGACPQCGSPAWADAGQVRSMLKVQMVYSHMNYEDSLISDESEDRSNVFYCKQLLVDVDEEHDISSAYRMDNADFPFGYEFVRKATLREVNFGESDMTGEKLSVSGVEEVRKGFKICKYCGTIQGNDKKRNHSFDCKAKKMALLSDADAYEDCLFLYREFTTEVLRILIPATTMDATNVKVESFVAAFMLGMKEYFGNVDHLRATVSEVPVPDADYRKQYLVIYDSVPGGTGYLKQLMHEENALVEIFEKSLHVMEECTCKEDPKKDGCYHCLYAYRQSRQIGNISRRTAIRLLKSILSGKKHIEKIRKLNDIPVNPLFDSELELRFMEAIRQKAGADHVKDILRNGKHSYYLKVGELAWEIEPQVALGPSDGVAVSCKPDFVFWPVSHSEHRPVAVFTDGFTYHKDIVADDTLKREAIRRSGKFRVWALSFKDVQSVFDSGKDHFTENLAWEKMPSGGKLYQGMVNGSAAKAISPAKRSSFDLLLEYLEKPHAEEIFGAQAQAYGLSLLEGNKRGNEEAFGLWQSSINRVNEEAHFTDSEFSFPGTLFGEWVPRSSQSHFTVLAGIMQEDLKGKKPVTVCALLQDEEGRRTAKYEQEWNGFWRFFNVMQFGEKFMAVSSVGLAEEKYLALPVPSEDTEMDMPLIEATVGNVWQAIREILFDEESKSFSALAASAGIPAPEADHVGYEVEGKSGAVVATIELAWPEKKIGFMTEEQLGDREKVEALGWRIVSSSAITDGSAMKLFGGNEK